MSIEDDDKEPQTRKAYREHQRQSDDEFDQRDQKKELKQNVNIHGCIEVKRLINRTKIFLMMYLNLEVKR
ncbi:hypothetical protein [Paucilactobacillus hokkaidonensis]|uniref:hypothetical protein n=1 Tax=Paucilactobacillus hokkaidonensis TaxID=1193095 RepID=UPI0006CF919C|nr:hypothetical protein [Paucilactobacillus hokkaidonensis]